MREVARVTGIYICAAAGSPMRPVNSVDVLADVGFVGDRYGDGTGFWQTLKNARPAIRHVSFISQEDIDAANEEFGTIFTAAETRRNILIEGYGRDLRELIGRRLRVGQQVIFRGAEECTPCGRPSQLSGKKFFEKAFRTNGRGGLRAEALSSGVVRVRDGVYLQVR